MKSVKISQKEHMLQAKTPRDAAFMSLVLFEKKGFFIKDMLDIWQKTQKPETKDFSLAVEIACGTTRLKRLIDYFIEEAVKVLPKKKQERILIRLSLYQMYFLEKIPSYAIISESMALAKKYCHPTFCQFLYAFLHNIQKPDPPKELAIRYSYPDYFVQKLLKAYDKAAVVNILEAQNSPKSLMIRSRQKVFTDKEKKLLTHAELFSQEPLIYTLKNSKELKAFTENPAFYIQNSTQPELIFWLKSHLNIVPKNILDMCAAPGGKSLLLKELYPEAALFANDASKERLKKFEENKEKYSLSCHVSCEKAETFSSDTKFDLIVVDAPCSSSGVLYKSPEARWRLEAEHIKQLNEIQLSILKNAATLLSNNGRIWYLTCSILLEENEELLFSAEKAFALQIVAKKTILPDKIHEGGFACLLQKKCKNKV